MISSVLFRTLRPALFALPPEEAHRASLRALECGLYPRPAGKDPVCLAVSAFGLQFSNPVAIAAGFDKDARVADAVVAMGCGFAEVGTTTPRPQSGNPAPRVFRLTDDDALINRLGFNNQGHQAALRNLSRRRPNAPLIVNIGANKDSTDRIADYVAGLNAFYALASAFMINISSPNTPGLRDLQAPDTLARLIEALITEREAKISAGEPRRPLIVKFAPDIAEEDLQPIISRLLEFDVDGIAVSNTTLSRSGITSAQRVEAGGLSGRPLFDRATVMLARVHQLTQGKVPLIGIGGIDSGARALDKIKAGATLLELYTGLIYQGPGLIAEIKDTLARYCSENGIASLNDIVGQDRDAWANKTLAKDEP